MPGLRLGRRMEAVLTLRSMKLLVISSSLLLSAMALAAPGAPRVPTAAVMSADGALVAAQEHSTVRLWRRADGKLLCSFESDAFFRGAVAKGAMVLVLEGGLEVRRGPACNRRIKLKAPRSLSVGRTAISADGSAAAVIYTSGGGVGDHDTVGVYDAAAGAELARIHPGKGARIMGAVLGPRGRVLAIFGDRRGKRALLEVYRLNSRRGKTRRGRARRVMRWTSRKLKTTYSAAISPDGETLALGAGERILLWNLKRTRLLGDAPTSAIKAIFPPILRGPGVNLPGAHQLTFSSDSRRLASLHAFGVVGVASWSVPALKPTAWTARPQGGGTMRQVAWDRGGVLRLITAGYAAHVTVHAPRANRFTSVRVLTPSESPDPP